ncbi:MAG: hypothetical protein J6K53_07130 [Roseburia sp.]|nr:hypothetical protein [Roseburia sp.]
MKKTISICLFAALLLAVCLFAAFYRNRRPEEALPDATLVATEQATESAQPVTAESMQVQKAYRYILRAKDDFLVVYEQDGTTILLETHIHIDELSDETKALLTDGIYVESESELYDLLESYSS